MAPEFDLELLSSGDVPRRLAGTLNDAKADGRLALAELRGTPLVINLWASWCEPCRVEAPILEAGWKEHGRQGVLFLGIDQQDARDAAREFIRRFEVTYPNVHEAGREIAREFRATGLPETFFVTAEGQSRGT